MQIPDESLKVTLDKTSTFWQALHSCMTGARSAQLVSSDTHACARAHLHTYGLPQRKHRSFSCTGDSPAYSHGGYTYKASFFSWVKLTLQNSIWYDSRSVSNQAYKYQYWRVLNIRWGFCLFTDTQIPRPITVTEAPRALGTHAQKGIKGYSSHLICLSFVRSFFYSVRACAAGVECLVCLWICLLVTPCAHAQQG